ncbi:MAG: SDR family oxidoreductase [Deltaproteobacteria bacterium]|nr:SDR family oxidoreductase [Deltaproteobacteria bacterium]
MHDTTVIVTGANRGIGLEVARGLAHRGARVVLACRDRGRGEDARGDLKEDSGNSNLHVMQVDLASPASIRAFGAAFSQRFDRLDVLVNNAGMFSTDRQETGEGFEATLATNHLGPLLLSLELLPSLRSAPTSRIVHVSSEAAWHATLDLDDLQMTRGYGRYGFDAYARSKLAQVYGVRELARRLKGTGITVNAVHPGHVATNIYPDHRWWWRAVKWVQARFALSPADAAVYCIRLACDADVATVSGQFFSKETPVELPDSLRSEDVQQRLWADSLKLLDVDPKSVPDGSHPCSPDSGVGGV